MLGRFGETHESHGELLDRRQIAAMAISLLTLAIGAYLEYAPNLHVTPWLPRSLYSLGILLLGGPIILNAIRGLLSGHTNVDELVALALIASTLGGFFLEADVVAILMVAGSMFEQRASLKARRAIEQLLKLAPAEAIVVKDDGTEQTIPAENLRPAMRILVRTGQRIPADGIVEGGASHIDQSAVTGESVPIYRQIGETVFAGSLTLDSSLTLRVTRAGQDSTVGQIIKIVQEAEQYQAPAMRIADQWARYYTPLILIVAALTLAISWTLHHTGAGAFAAAWQRAVAVLVVGCPCTIVLATPTAIIAATGRAARLGLLIKHGAVLEKAAKVDTLIFDKTGTLTSGQHQVVAIVPAEDLKGLDEVIGLCPALDHSILKLQMGDERPAQPDLHRAPVGPALPDNSRCAPVGPALPDTTSRDSTSGAKIKLLSLAAAVEHASTHPFARAIREHAQSQNLNITPATDIREIPGVGVQGRISGQRVIVARPEYIARSIRNACAVPGTMIRPIRRYSVIAVEVAGNYAGLILLRDAMRPAAQAIVEDLRETGLTNLSVLSGDHKGAVKLVADQLKLDHAYSGLLPADKAGQIKALKEQGHLVAFVGDGINDAPALATADIGIAMGASGTDIALETADVVLLNDRIELLATFFALSRKVRSTIYGNLIFGLALNLAALVLASSGILSPMTGALVHNLGSAFVVANSARLAAFGRVAQPDRASTIESEAKRAAA